MEKEKKEWFGLQEQMGSHKGHISRTQKMTQAQANKINKRIDCIKWVKIKSEFRRRRGDDEKIVETSL